MNCLKANLVLWSLLGFKLKILLIYFILNQCAVKGDIYSSISVVATLIETEESVIRDLGVYLDKQEKMLETLKRQVENIQRDHEIAAQDAQDYVGNPVNAFRLIKRLTIDLEDIKKTTEEIQNTTFVLNKTFNYPDEEDLNGAALGLARLQSAYRLNVTELADGILKTNYSHNREPYYEKFSPMAPIECFVIAQSLYDQDEFEAALAWLLEAHRKVESGHLNLFYYIALAYYGIGDSVNSLKWTEKLLDLDPNDSDGIALKEECLKKIKNKDESNEEQQNKTMDDLGLGILKKPGVDMQDYDENWIGFYEALCRGDFRIQYSMVKKLKCRYKTETHPFLRLAPVKMEQVYIKPDVFIYYDMITDDEIKELKNFGHGNFERATVLSDKGDGAFSKHRTSQSAWMDDSHATSARLSRRVGDVTGFEMSGAETLQIANYGVGGQYEPHFDYLSEKHLNNTELSYHSFGNRISTVLIYMSDVAQGGATVFPELGLTVFPVKGAALAWMNLHPSGQGDRATLHAACPVLRGSKWACNKWVRENAQMFRRPCDKDNQTHAVFYEIPEPVHYIYDL